MRKSPSIICTLTARGRQVIACMAFGILLTACEGGESRKDAGAYIKDAQTAFAAGNLRLARAELADALSEFPREPAVQRELGRLAFAIADFDAVLCFLGHAVLTSPLPLVRGFLAVRQGGVFVAAGLKLAAHPEAEGGVPGVDRSVTHTQIPAAVCQGRTGRLLEPLCHDRG